LKTTPGSPARTPPYTPKRKAPSTFLLWLQADGRGRRSRNKDRGRCLGVHRGDRTGRTQWLRLIRRWAREHTGHRRLLGGILGRCGVNTITNFAYQGPVSVSPGSTVTVKNEDSQAHTVTSDQAGLFDAVVPGGGNVVFTAPTAG